MKTRRKRYVHFGQNEYNPEKYQKEGFYCHNKPFHGFWGSPVTAFYRWDEFCRRENFQTETLDKRFYFRISACARILKVRKPKDIHPYMILNHEQESSDVKFFFNMWEIDFDKIMKYYDGMEVIHTKDNWSIFHSYNYFWTWDVDSIVVWNTGVIVPDRTIEPDNYH